ncbi:MAG: diaminohydroxyphosphoribosylaminopyrimidine reductase [Candidatus Altiarchaeales archaeon ex4484_2]|nr:MAG: diaminohydroxyphosphoribosylaminopyrimidine reductase [Candidatus Altiarchaeales archaeon ex4484_2]
MKKPFIFINSAMTVDGKISTLERRQVRISSQKDMDMVDKLRAGSDAVLVGMNTLLTDDPKLTVKSGKLREERLEKGLSENPMKVAVGRIDSVNLDSEFLNYGNAEKIFFASRDSDTLKIDELGDMADVYVSVDDEIDPCFIAKTLHGLGVRRLMIEGGAETNYRFLKAGLVDEIYVTVAPRIFGGRDAPTLVDGAGFMEGQALKLKLLSMNRKGDELLLKYRVSKR